MRSGYWPIVLVMWGCAYPALAQGVASNDSFVVLGPDRETARQILSLAENNWYELLREWGLAEKRGPRSRIHLFYEADQDRSRTTVAGDGRHPQITLRVHANTVDQIVTPLRHELFHAVAADFELNLLPCWEEAMASIANVDSGTWSPSGVIARQGSMPAPGVLRNLTSQTVLNDERQYAAATSLAQILIAQAGKAKFCQFAKERDVANALMTHYGMEISELESQWRRSLERTATRTFSLR